MTEKLAELEAQLAAEGKSADLQVDAERFMVAISDGRHLPDPRYLARVVAEDPDLDLAILRIDSDERGTPLDPETLDLPILPLGMLSDAVNLGQTVHVFGFPAIGAGSLTYTIGIVSGFLFEEGIDGTAWINTDAVTSGGNSGGAAVNDAGQLIGVPSAGSALDCRVEDTNRDGVVSAEDVGCLPTGGSLTQLRPIDLARPLLCRSMPRYRPKRFRSPPQVSRGARMISLPASRPLKAVPNGVTGGVRRISTPTPSPMTPRTR